MGGTGEKSAAEGEAEVFGPYEVYERLGVGGMATVHRALEKGIAGFQREVALKRLLPELAQDEGFVASFIREAKLAALLSHANIVQIFELGRVGPTYFISMEYIPGSDLRRVLKQARRIAGPPPLSVTVSLLFELCDALDYAHLRKDEEGEPLGLIHRDISPSNLLVSAAGHLKIIDFGLARATTIQHRSKSGRLKGKLAYMAPEAIDRTELDPRADIFSAGVIAYELLTAEPLFAAPTDYRMIEHIRKDEIAPPGEKNSAVPGELDALVLKALARAPRDRWQSAASMRAALEELAIRQNLHATNLDVIEWIRWALSGVGQDPGPPSGSYPTETGSPGLDLAAAPVQSFLQRAADESEEELSVEQVDDRPTIVDLSGLAAGKLARQRAREENRAETDDEDVDATETGTAETAPVSEKEEEDEETETRTRPVTPEAAGEGGEDTDVTDGGQDSDQVGVGEEDEYEEGPTLHREPRKRPVAPGRMTARQSVPPIPTGKATESVVTFQEPARAKEAEGQQPGAESRPVASELADEVQASLEPADINVRTSMRLRPWLAGAAALILSVAFGFSAGIYLGAGEEVSQPATLAIESSPPGLAAAVDGEKIEGETPVVVEVAPGSHQVTISSDSGPVWEGEIEAEAGTRYHLHPVLIQQ